MFCKVLLIIGFGLTVAQATLARDYYATPTGAGSRDGSNWANAISQSQMENVLDSSMLPGDVLHLGSGTYSQAIHVDSIGTASSPKRIVGEDTGGGLPIIDMGSWDRTAPGTTGAWSAIGFGNLASYWIIEKLVIQDVRHAVKTDDLPSGQFSGITLRNLTIRNCRHPMYISDAKDWLIENIKASEYTKHGIRFDHNCTNIMVRKCTADLSNGDSTWYQYTEVFPFGFVVEVPGTDANDQPRPPSSNITFEDCLSLHHRKNTNQPSYWNGDGFLVNQGNTGFFKFVRCRALDNEDGGFDIKPPVTTDPAPTVTMVDCVAFQNKRNFRFHSGRATMTNCVAGYPTRRDGNSLAGVWLSSAIVTIDFCTLHGSAGDGVIQEDGNGQATVRNSIISSESSSSLPKSGNPGNVTLESSTVTYTPVSGVDPQYVNPHQSWDGVGTDMNSNTYGSSKGYFQDPNSGNPDHQSRITNTAPTIDGLVDSNWNYANSQSINNAIFGTVTDANDLSGSFRTLWDPANLYVLIEVADDALQNDSGLSTWHDDSVEIYIDANNDKPTAYGGNDYQYRFTWTGSFLRVEETKHNAIVGVTASRVVTANGYVVEVMLPWSTLGQSSATFGALLGLDVHINDDDNGGSRDGKKAWFNTVDTSWQNPSTFATAILESNHEVVQTATPPSINGNVEAAWSSANSTDIANVVVGAVTNGNDLSGSFRTLWDSNNLYVLVQVNDEAQHNDSGTQSWNDDSAEIYIDANNDKATAYGGNDHRYHFTWTGSSVRIEDLQHHPITGVMASRVATATGYTIEVQLPWSTLGQSSAAVNALVGLDVHINDDDDGGTRDGKKAWFNTVDTSWQSPSTFATARLIGIR
jgi:hypothetical protein